MKLKADKKPAQAQSLNLPSDHAVAALKALLAQVSAIKLREVRIECSAPSRELLIACDAGLYCAARFGRGPGALQRKPRRFPRPGRKRTPAPG